MIELRHVSAGYPGRAVLQDITLTFSPGQVTALLGPNGCGKSTLLKTLVRILPRTGGQILVDGAEIDTLSPAALAQRVAYLPQNRTVPEITAGRMVLHGRFPYLHYPRRYRKTDLEAAERAMAKLGIGDLADTPMAQLSGGMRQKVYIAMALAQDSPTILLDEPTTYLDVAHQLQLMELAKALAASGKAVVLVLHDLTMAMADADCLAVLENGTLAGIGSPEALYAQGILDRVFGIRLSRFAGPDGWQYYYQKRE